MDESKLIECIKKHEGCEQFGYIDSLGYLTISIGRCIDRRKGKGISPEEQIYLLKNDIADCKFELERYSWYLIQDDVRKCALIELVFNMGIGNLLKFKKFLAAMESKDYTLAHKELLDSRWAIQVKKERSKNIAYRIAYGTYPE